MYVSRRTQHHQFKKNILFSFEYTAAFRHASYPFRLRASGPSKVIMLGLKTLYLNVLLTRFISKYYENDGPPHYHYLVPTLGLLRNQNISRTQKYSGVSHWKQKICEISRDFLLLLLFLFFSLKLF